MAAALDRLEIGSRIVIGSRGRERRAAVLDLSRSGRITAGWLAGGRRVAAVPGADVRVEVAG